MKTYKALERMNGNKVVATVDAENIETAKDMLIDKIWEECIELCDDLGYENYYDIEAGFNVDFIVIEA